MSSWLRDCHIRLCLAVFIAAEAVSGAVPATAEPKEPSIEQAQSQSDSEQEPAEYNGGDITRPQNQLDVRLQYRTSWQPDTRTQQERMLLRVTSKLKLDAGWRAGLLGEAPFVDKRTTTFDSNNSGNASRSENKFGVGDAAFQTYLAHDLDQNWAFGFGARGVGPSAQDSLGSGKWQIMPGLGVRYSFADVGPDTYFVPVIRYALSVAGDPTRRNIRQAQISPKLNIGLSERWFITLYPSYDVRINYGPSVPGQTGTLFLPFDAAVGREISEGVQLSLEVSVLIIRDFPVYNFQTELRVVARF
jgi:Putative MetA-pathway of phenol degradation